MKELIFWLIYLITVAITSYKILKSISYFNADYRKTSVKNLYEKLSVIQLVEGFSLEINEKNREVFGKANFIYVIDKNRGALKNKIEKSSKENYEIVEVDEDSTYFERINKALEISREYFIVLKDTLEVKNNPDEIIRELSTENFAVNGLIYDNSSGYGKISKSFFNWHSLFSYLSLGELGLGESLNLYFFGGKAQFFIENKILSSSNQNSSDVTEKLILNGLDVFQSRVIAENNGKIDNRIAFFDNIGEEIERILAVAKESTSIRVYFITLFPFVLSSLVFIYSLFLNLNFTILVLGTFFIKAIDTYVIRKSMEQRQRGLSEIFVEVFMDVIGVFLLFIRKSR